jgi:hypothetical protein
MTITTPQIVSGATTVSAPAMTANGGNYVLAWRMANASIWWMTFPAANERNTTKYDFGPQKNVAGIASSGGPALATFKGKVWMAWKGDGADTRIFLSSLSGSTWAPGSSVSAVGTQSAPALTATSSELFLAYRGERDNTIYYAKSADGANWGAGAAVPGALSSDTPALAAFGDTVHLVWKGASDNKIWLATYTPAGGWGGASALSDFDSSKGPALGVGSSGHLHLAWQGASDNDLWESSLASSSTNWSPEAQIAIVATSSRPALATQTSEATEVMLAWRNGADDTLWVGPIDSLETLVTQPPGGYQGSANYILANGSNCATLTGVKATIKVTEDLVWQSSQGPGGRGFSIQLNAETDSNQPLNWLQFVVHMGTDKGLWPWINIWNPSGIVWDQAVANPVAIMPQAARIPAGYSIVIALENDSERRVTGATWNVLDGSDKSVGSVSYALSNTAGGGVPPGDLSPIASFQVTFGGGDDGGHATFSSGAGVVVLQADQAMTVDTSYPNCVGFIGGTAETSNVAYGKLGATPNKTFSQAFSVKADSAVAHFVKPAARKLPMQRTVPEPV